jgi:hypothetical protein
MLDAPLNPAGEILGIHFSQNHAVQGGRRRKPARADTARGKHGKLAAGRGFTRPDAMLPLDCG